MWPEHREPIAVSMILEQYYHYILIYIQIHHYVDVTPIHTVGIKVLYFIVLKGWSLLHNALQPFSRSIVLPRI